MGKDGGGGIGGTDDMEDKPRRACCVSPASCGKDSTKPTYKLDKKFTIMNFIKAVLGVKGY
jgi:hypothetical protein